LLAENTDLTSKEWAIIALISQGSTNSEIASSIHASEPMVKDHLRRIFQKTGCWNRTEVSRVRAASGDCGANWLTFVNDTGENKTAVA